jgi:hypothetical protein
VPDLKTKEGAMLVHSIKIVALLVLATLVLAGSGILFFIAMYSRRMTPLYLLGIIACACITWYSLRKAIEMIKQNKKLDPPK